MDVPRKSKPETDIILLTLVEYTPRPPPLTTHTQAVTLYNTNLPVSTNPMKQSTLPTQAMQLEILSPKRSNIFNNGPI